MLLKKCYIHRVHLKKRFVILYVLHSFSLCCLSSMLCHTVQHHWIIHAFGVFLGGFFVKANFSQYFVNNQFLTQFNIALVKTFCSPRRNSVKVLLRIIHFLRTEENIFWSLLIYK